MGKLTLDFNAQHKCLTHFKCLNIVNKLKDSLLDIYINSYIHKLYETILFFTG